MAFSGYNAHKEQVAISVFHAKGKMGQIVTLPSETKFHGLSEL